MKKRIFAALLSVALVMPSATVFAGEISSGGEINVGGESNYVDYLNSTIDVTVPTEGAITFALDPQGFSAIEEGDELSLTDIQQGIGGEVGVVASSGLIVLGNNSQYPVTANLRVTLAAITDVTAMTTDAELADMNEKPASDGSTPAPLNMALWLTPSAVDLGPVSTEDPEAAVAAVENAFIPVEKAIPLADDAIVQYNAFLPGSEVMVTRQAGELTTRAADGSGHSTALKLGGLCNPNAIWTDVAPAFAVAFNIQRESDVVYAAGANNHEPLDGAGFGAVKAATSTNAAADDTTVPAITLSTATPKAAAKAITVVGGKVPTWMTGKYDDDPAIGTADTGTVPDAPVDVTFALNLGADLVADGYAVDTARSSLEYIYDNAPMTKMFDNMAVQATYTATSKTLKINKAFLADILSKAKGAQNIKVTFYFTEGTAKTPVEKPFIVNVMKSLPAYEPIGVAPTAP